MFCHIPDAEKLIINVALTGIVPTKGDSPHLPVTPEEIADDARRCRDAGASIVHIHARDDRGLPTYRAGVFYEIMTRIRRAVPDMIICGSASARMSNDEGQRAEVLNPGPGCKPDLASLTMGSMNFRDQASFNPPSAIEWLARAMRAGGIVPELEFFDLGMVDYTKFLIKKGVIGEPLYGNIILGSLGTLSASPLNLATIVGALPEKMVWSAGGLGRFQFYVNAMAITMGGHVRLGLEDSLYYDAVKTQLATNAGLVERVVKLALAAGREIASPDEARMIIGLPLRNGAAAPISRSLD